MTLNSLLKIIDNPLNITKENIIGLKGLFPYIEEGQENNSSSLYPGKIVSITDNNIYDIHFDDGDS